MKVRAIHIVESSGLSATPQMRISLPDVILLSLSAATSAIALLPIVLRIPLANGNVKLGILYFSAFTICLVLSSFLYRLLRWRPMLLPKCPVCRWRDRHYQTQSYEWPIEIIECARCRAHIELCHDNRKHQRARSNLPQFDLLWPYSFGGRWRRVGNSDENRPTDGAAIPRMTDRIADEGSAC